MQKHIDRLRKEVYSLEIERREVLSGLIQWI